MDQVPAQESFKEWSILELMGHRKLAGLVSEATIAGGSFIRIDIYPPSGNDAVVTQIYSPGAIYCITPCTEDLARAMNTIPTPVTRYELPTFSTERELVL